MKQTILTEADILSIIIQYQSGKISSTHKLAEKFKTTHKRIRRVLNDNKIPINKKGGQIKYTPAIINDRFNQDQNYVAVCKKTKKQFNDYTNSSGALLKHIQLIYPNIKIPTKYIRNRQYKTTGVFWHEDYFDIIVDTTITKETLNCPYCNWSTIDVKNSSGSFSKHLQDCHNINIFDFIQKYPDYITIGVMMQNTVNRQNQLKNKDNFIVCEVCKTKFKSLTLTHLKTHELNFIQYRNKYPNSVTHSNATIHKLSESTIQLNQKLLLHYKENNLKMPWHAGQVYDQKLAQNFDEYKVKISNDFDLVSDFDDYKQNNQTFKCKNCDNIFTSDNRYPRCYHCNPLSQSKEENEICDFLSNELGLTIERNNRKLIKYEIDIYVPSHNIGIEFHGLYWHAELSNGKTRGYHINKTKLCNNNGITLYQIFSDEWLNKKEIVKSKLKNIFKINKDKVFARNCIIKNINSNDSIEFLNNNHIQGGINSSIRIGLYYRDRLVSLMTFSANRKIVSNPNINNEYELTRYATNINVVGGASKLLSHFITSYHPNKIISYADIRWTPNPTNNLYNKLGFNFVHQSLPNYWYTKDYINREYRFNYRKDVLVKNGFNTNKSEWVIMKERGYDRIWDCGNYKYELKIG